MNASQLATIDSEIAYEIECLPEDIPIKGNAMASGDDDADAAIERGIAADLEHNEWAWCTVRVWAEWNGLTVSECLGCCSYRNRKDFEADGYYKDMKAEARSRLITEIESVQVG